MEKKLETVTFLNTIKDTFPYVESTIIILDNKLGWWKKNGELFEQELANEIRGLASTPIDVRTRLIIYSGPEQQVQAVQRIGPALEFTLQEVSSEFVLKVKNKIGNTWNGHRLITDENKLIVMFE